MELSPVIQAFLAGQQGQSSLLSRADESKDRAAQRKLQQQQIDEVVKQHLAEAQQHADRMSLDTKRAELERQSHVADYMQRFKAGLADGSIPKQSQALAGSVNIPGMPMAAPPMDTAYGDTPNVQGMAPGIQIPGMSTSMVSPTQTTASPYGGDITVGTPRDAGEAKIADAVNQAKALLPVQLQAEQAKFDINSPKWQAEVERRVHDAELKAETAQAHLAQVNELTRLGFFNKSELTQAKAENEAAKRYDYMSPEDWRSTINDNVQRIAVGGMKYNEVPAKQRADTNTGLAAAHFSANQEKPIAEAMQRAQDAAKAIPVMQRMQELIGSNGPKGQLANLIRSIPWVGQLSGDKKEFDQAMQTLKPPLIQAQAESLARASGNVKALNMETDLLPGLMDKGSTVVRKVPNVLDIYMGAIATKISNLSPEHRQVIWNKVWEDQPSLRSTPVGKKIFDAAQTGEYKMGFKNAGK